MDLPLGQPTRREFLVHGSAALALGTEAPSVAFPAGGTPLEFMVIGDWGRDGAFHQRQVAAARGVLFPHGKAQDRALNAVPLWVRFGDGFTDTIRPAVAAHARRIVTGAASAG